MRTISWFDLMIWSNHRQHLSCFGQRNPVGGWIRAEGAQYASVPVPLYSIQQLGLVNVEAGGGFPQFSYTRCGSSARTSSSRWIKWDVSCYCLFLDFFCYIFRNHVNNRLGWWSSSNYVLIVVRLFWSVGQCDAGHLWRYQQFGIIFVIAAPLRWIAST